LAIAIRGDLRLALGLVHHSEAIPAVVHFGIPLNQIPSGSFGFLELAGVHKIDGGVGGLGQLVLFLGIVVGIAEDLGNGLFLHALAFGTARRLPLLPLGLLLEELLVLGRLVLWLAALLVLLTAATGAGIIASRFGHPGQCLGARGRYPCIRPCWATPPFMICCWPVMRTSPIRRAASAA